MRYRYLPLVAILALLSSTSRAQLPQTTLSGNITSTRTLSSDTAYVLQGFVVVKNGGVINIPAGTLIYGDSASTGTLIIERGGKIHANGTSSRPVVFTSRKPIGQRTAGDWGGVILCGIAGTNLPGDSAAIEGAGTIFGPGASFARNDDDSSGVMRYVRIEFSGVPFSPNNEINGLTMGGVGRKTVLEYIQVSYNNDDSFEWFGGTVNAKYLIAYKGLDDEFDTDNGYRGKLQFLLGIRDADIADVSQSNGLEADNNASGSMATPRSNPTVSNMTVIGPAPDSNATVNSLYRRAAHLRRATRYGIYNSIFMGWPIGLFIDGTATAAGAQEDSLQIRNSVFAGKWSTLITTNEGSFDVVAWYNNGAYGNAAYPAPANVQLTNPFGSFASFDPRPAGGTPMLSGASFSGRLSGDSFFDVVTFRGAFGGERWDLPWAEYDPQNVDYTNGVPVGVREIATTIPQTMTLEQNFPNPFNPSTVIRYQLPVAGQVSLKIFNMLGQEIRTLVDDGQNPGAYEVDFDASHLPSGVYFYRLASGRDVQIRKMVLMK
jgi:hypothetical protein